jgi:IS5 family transposase
MRKRNQKQMPLMIPDIDHPRAKELERISQLLDRYPIMSKLVWQDLTCTVSRHGAGAHGMSADQVLRAAIIKQTEQFSYEDLSFHLLDSRCYRRFCRIGFAHKGFKKSCLALAIKSIRSETWEAINRLIVAHAQNKDVEKGRKVRMDCTVVCSDIHEPTDSSLLWDSVRVITHLLEQLRDRTLGVDITFKDHRRVTKRRALAIRSAKNGTIRKRLYRDLLRYTEKTLGYAKIAIRAIEGTCSLPPVKVLSKLKIAMELTYRVIDQTTRRVIMGKRVPAEDKVVSLFEPHTDIIKKDRRETLYGHKVCLTVGQSNLVTDCLITKGNPADSTLVEAMLNRHNSIYGRYPLKIALDGGFASKNNLDFAKSHGINDVCFGKRRGMTIGDMCRSRYVYKRLRRFRAGIESAISWLKRCFGFDRCIWKSLPSFKRYVWCSVVSGNLLTLARSSAFK